jgi:hypothetical protein
MPPPMVLMLDGDVDFMLALAQELTKRRILSCSARTVREARSMITRFQLAPDALVIDCSIRGACSLAAKIAEAFRNVEIVGIVSTTHRCEECAERPAAILDDSNDKASDPIPHCADLIQSLLRKQSPHDDDSPAG